MEPSLPLADTGRVTEFGAGLKGGGPTRSIPAGSAKIDRDRQQHVDIPAVARQRQQQPLGLPDVVDDREYRASAAIADLTALHRDDELRIALETGEIRVQFVHPVARGVAPGNATVLGAGHPVPEAQRI